MSTINPNTKPTMRFDGELVYITGNCPLPWCEWTHTHSHSRETLHEYAKDRAAAKKLETTGKATGPAPVTNASSPGTPSTAPKPTITHMTPSRSPYLKTPEKKKKYINVYRVRTVSANLVLDVTVMGEKRKEAVATARESHSQALRIPLKDVSLSFARYVWQYEVVEHRTSPYRGSSMYDPYGEYMQYM